MKQRLNFFSVFLIALLGITSFAFCQSLELSEEYTQSALWIDTGRNTEFYTSYPSEGVFSTTSPVELRWTPFLGTQPLEKETFFQIAGMQEEALRYKQAQKTARIFNWTGLSLFLAGTLLLAGSQTIDPDSKVLLYSSLGLIFGGIASGGIGIIIDNSSQIPASEAAQAAVRYNENLKLELGLE
ncbi:hypothetical protein SpiGrapes_2690 [Sphaerochaeta pleomorpha str. Grapes]|uniref:Uncharacterized protein n=1 Tax=Sphaerochaeta pleomorpha (strain ATCC BAA-1885 / DSM 22778 / Grapes) TaxID=158190 RepID=G8QVD3_SPHPG|nr:hypothetical protein [Sphaerochaeta pleomorpha]AEV30448.1 hypothetical protein SpiGrapes_2690 [Sphaerochaeta pleomorpha str. Grapes]